MERESVAPPRWTAALAVTFCLAGLFAWHGWLTLSLFGTNRPLDKLLNGEPVISGFHPLHQYHGYVGARAILHTRRCSCYDPAFYVGYLKTPVFDSGSRPAEVCMVLTGGEFDPAAYKVGIAAICLLAPLLLLTAARGAGLCWLGTLFAVALGQLVWWGGPAQAALHAGDIHLLLAGLLLAAYAGLLIGFDRAPTFLVWCGLLATATAGWFAHPLLFSLSVPLFLFYYLSAGVRHRSLGWHVFLWLSQAAALGINVIWLYDFVVHWWVHAPLPLGGDLLPHRTLRAIWSAPFWGAAEDRALAVALLVAGLVGVVIFNQRGQRNAARLFGLGAGGLLALAILGVCWELAGRIGTSVLIVPALWFAAVAASRTVSAVVELSRRLIAAPWTRRAVLAGLVLVAGAPAYPYLAALAPRCVRAVPLEIGLGAERQKLIEMLLARTDSKSRILWEDRPADRGAPRWAALLPLLTGRNFIGGLDPDGRMHYSHVGFVRGQLAGRPVGSWTDDALRNYCERYNVGAVVVWSPSAAARFHKWKAGAQFVGELHDDATGYLFRVAPATASYALHGKATVQSADCRRIVLTNVEPQDGKVVLSLHYQSGLRASPSRVKIEPEPNIHDRVPLLRLKVASPVSRVSLTWEGE